MFFFLITQQLSNQYCWVLSVPQRAALLPWQTESTSSTWKTFTEPYSKLRPILMLMASTEEAKISTWIVSFNNYFITNLYSYMYTYNYNPIGLWFKKNLNDLATIHKCMLHAQGRTSCAMLLEILCIEGVSAF